MLKQLSIKIFNIVLVMIAVVIIFVALLLNATRLAMPLLDKKRVYFEQWASHIMHQPVKIGTIQGAWHNFEPTLTFRNVNIGGAKGGYVLTINQLSVGIDWFDSLLKRKLLPGNLSIIGTHVDIVQNAQGQLFVRGVSNQRKNVPSQTTNIKAMLVWLLTQANIHLRKIDIDFYTKDDVLLPLRDLQLKINNNFLQHQISGMMKMNWATPSYWQINATVTHYDLNNNKVNAHIFLQVLGLNLQRFSALPWFQSLQKRMQVTHGNLNARLWFNWQGQVPQTIKGEIDLKNLIVIPHIVPNIRKPIVIKQLATNMEWSEWQQGLQIDAHQILLQLDNLHWQENNVRFQIRKDILNHSLYLLQIGFLKIHNLREVIRKIDYFLPTSIKNLDQSYYPQATLQNISLQWQDVNKNFLIQHFSTQFTDLAWKAQKKIPGVEHLSGELNYMPEEGSLILNSQDSILRIPMLYTQGLNFQKIFAQLTWRQRPNGMVFRMKKFILSNLGLNIEGMFHLFLSSGASPNLSLLAGFQVNDAKILHNYVPAKILNANLGNWLKQAFVAGQLNNGTIAFNGHMNQFPFKQHQGTFEINSNIHDLSLRFNPNWPALRQIDGNVNFTGQRMSVTANQAMIMGNPLTHLQAVIPDLSKATLSITGESSSTLVQGWKLLQASPLHFVKSLQGAVLQGLVHAQLSIKAILYGKSTQVLSSGDINFTNGILSLPSWKIHLTAVNGLLHFMNEVITAQNMQATFLQQPLKVAIDTINSVQAKDIKISFAGRLSINQVVQQFHIPYLNYLSGSTLFHAFLMLPEVPKKNVTFALASNLQGVQITGLPANYNKAPQELKSFSLHMQITPQQLLIKMDYAKLLSMAIILNKAWHDFVMNSIAITLGGGDAVYQTASGLVVNGFVKKIDWHEWQDFLQKLMATENKKMTQMKKTVLRYVALKTQQLIVFGQNLVNVDIKLIPLANGFAVTLKNTLLDGTLNVPTLKSQEWQGHFSRLVITALEGKSQENIQPQNIPPLNFVIDNFIYANNNLGAVTLQSTPMRNGMRISQLTITNRTARFVLSGFWRHMYARDFTNIRGVISYQDLGKFLSDWQVTNRLVGGEGTISFVLNWNDMPWAWQLEKISGDVLFNISNGRIIHLSSGTESELGIGRLLNLLSLQSLPERLTLHFGDLIKKGFPFHLFRGSFHLAQGNITTQGAYLMGTLAKVSIKGRIGMVAKDFDLYLQIIPHVTSSVPLIAGLAAGPLAGAIAWVANKVVGPVISKAAGTTYKVTGSWDQPKMVKVSNFR